MIINGILSLPPPHLFITDRFMLWFILIVNVRPLLFVCDIVQFISESLYAICWERAVLLLFTYAFFFLF